MVNNSKILRRNTERKAILTKAERENIMSGKMSSALKSKLYNKLDPRISALVDDLNIIVNSEIMETWRQVKKYQYGSEFAELAKIFEDLAGAEFKKIYLDHIRCDKNSKGKKVFWLEQRSSERILDKFEKKKKPYYSDRIFHPSYILRGLKETKDTKNLLIQAYVLKLIPTQKQKALKKEQIQKKIETEKRKIVKNEEISKCKRCGFRYSAKCTHCKERIDKKFKNMIKEMVPNEYVMFQSINYNQIKK